MTFPRLILRPLLVLAALVAGSGPGRAASTPTTPLTAEEQRLIAAVEAGKDDFGSALGQAVQIDSATENLAGVRQLGELFAQQLTELGFESRFVPLPASTGRAGHLVAEHRGTKGQRVLLIGHLDTVYPGANFTRAGDEDAGAGVADMKGGDIVMLHALRALHRAGLLADTQITVVMDGDEEAVGNPSNFAGGSCLTPRSTATWPSRLNRRSATRARWPAGVTPGGRSRCRAPRDIPGAFSRLRSAAGRCSRPPASCRDFMSSCASWTA